MGNWKRIALVVFVLIGGVSLFGYWSINQFNQAIDNLNAPYLANTHLAYQSFSRPDDRELASTSPDIFGDVATSTTLELYSTSTVAQLSFTFPQSNAEVYIGCTYPISWKLPATVDSLEATLIDAGTREPVGPKTGGLANVNTVEKESQHLNWKVGSVWPGAYYIKISKINGVNTEIRSQIFKINKMSESITASERAVVCKESDGLL